MSTSLTIPTFTEQNSLDFGFVGFAAVAEAKKTGQRIKDTSTLENAKKAARITTADLEREFGAPRFKPENRDLFENLENDETAKPEGLITAVDYSMPCQAAAGVTLESAPTPEIQKVQFPFTEANLKSARPFTDSPNRLTSKPLPVSSSMGREQDRIRQAQELAKKPVIGLMRTIHTSDGKMRRSQLADSQKVEAVARNVASNPFDPWADMVRKRIAEQANSSADTGAENEVSSPQPKTSGPRPGH